VGTSNAGFDACQRQPTWAAPEAGGQLGGRGLHARAKELEHELQRGLQVGRALLAAEAAPEAALHRAQLHALAHQHLLQHLRRAAQLAGAAQG